MRSTPCTRYSPKLTRFSGDVIGAAIELDRIMGPGLLESIYERFLRLRAVKLVDGISRLVVPGANDFEQKAAKATKSESQG